MMFILGKPGSRMEALWAPRVQDPRPDTRSSLVRDYGFRSRRSITVSARHTSARCLQGLPSLPAGHEQADRDAVCIEDEPGRVTWNVPGHPVDARYTPSSKPRSINRSRVSALNPGAGIRWPRHRTPAASVSFRPEASKKIASRTLGTRAGTCGERLIRRPPRRQNDSPLDFRPESRMWGTMLGLHLPESAQKVLPCSSGPPVNSGHAVDTDLIIRHIVPGTM